MDAAEVHTEILIYKHAELGWSHQPQVQHPVPDADSSVSLACPRGLSPPLQVPMDHGQAAAGGSELQQPLRPPLHATDTGTVRVLLFVHRGNGGSSSTYFTQTRWEQLQTRRSSPVRLSAALPVCPCDSVLGDASPWQGLLLSHVPEKPSGLESCFSFDFNLLLELSWCKTVCEEKNYHVCLESVK